jgi:hypothetical protein
VPPDGRSAGLHSFNMDANWFQKERLNYGRKLDTPCLNEILDFPKKDSFSNFNNFLFLKIKNRNLKKIEMNFDNISNRFL